IFSSYLLPTFKLPFRRRRSTNTSLNSDVPSLSSSPTPSGTGSAGDSPPPSPPSYLNAVSDDKCRPTTPVPTRRLSRAAPDTLRCSNCSRDIAFLSQIMSKGFNGRHGRAYLVSPSPPASSPGHFSLSHDDQDRGTASGHKLLNIYIGASESRQLVTGWHTVADITCTGCGVKLGWKYIDAQDPPQYYKIGKFILEAQRVSAFHSWEDVGVNVDGAHGFDRSANRSGETRAEDNVVFDSDDEDECEDIFAGVWDPVNVAYRRGQR
ncbi:yippee-domain-containing protein, partial [Sodiomyces alkalinus F11]